MRKSLLLTILLCCSCFTLTAKKLNVLCIGNSFTRNATKYLPQIAKSFPDCSLNLAIVYKGGASLKYHWERVVKADKDPNFIYSIQREGRKRVSYKTLKELLKARKWDIVVALQQYGHKPRFSYSQCEPYATNLYNYVKKYSPNSEIRIHHTWAYRPDMLRSIKNSPLHYNGYQGMYDTIKARYTSLARKFNARLLPSGFAMKLCQERHPFTRDPNFNYKKRYYTTTPTQMPKEQWSMHVGPSIKKLADGRFRFYIDFEHASPSAEYLLSCLWFEELFGKDARDITFKPDFMKPEVAKELRAIAHEAATTFVQPIDEKAMGLDTLIPKPGQIRKSRGICIIPPIIGIHNELRDARLDQQLSQLFAGRKVVDGNFLTIKKKAMAKGDEAYELTITPDRIEICAAAAAGAFYALQSLQQLAAGHVAFACGTINDWPGMEFRGIHLVAGWQYSTLKQVITEMSRLKLNKLVFEYGSKLPWKHGAGDAYSHEESRKLARFANNHFIEFIPLIASPGHMQPYLCHQKFASLREQPDQKCDICPQNSEARKFVKNLWKTALAPLPGNGFVHLAGDETFRTKPCPKCAPFSSRRGTLYRDYVADLSQWMAKQGKRSLIWGDMLLKHPEALNNFPRDIVICHWEYTGTNGDLSTPYMKYDLKGTCDKRRHKLFGNYWKKNSRGLYNPFIHLRFFGNKGFKTIAASASVCSYNSERWLCDLSPIGFFNNQRFALEAQKQARSCLGLLDTCWFHPMPGIWFGIVPGADFSWHPRREEFPDYVNRFATTFLRRPDWTETLLRLSALQEDDITGSIPKLDGVPGPGATQMAQDYSQLLNFTINYMKFVQSRRLSAGQAFRAGITGTPVPLDLSSAANQPLTTAMPPQAGHIAADSGKYNFHGIPFEFDRRNVISLSSATPDKPASLDLDRKVSGLLFWDTAYNAWPDMVLAKMTVNYTDGEKIHFDFIGGINLLDWRALRKTPGDKNTCVAAWRGRKETSDPIISWLTYWRNPEPAKKINSIKLAALPGKHTRESRCLFLAITALKGDTPPPAIQATNVAGLANLEAWARTNFPRWMKQGSVSYACHDLFSAFSTESGKH